MKHKGGKLKGESGESLKNNTPQRPSRKAMRSVLESTPQLANPRSAVRRSNELCVRQSDALYGGARVPKAGSGTRAAPLF